MKASAGLSRRNVGFGGHQLAEYALAAAVAVVGLHLSGRSELVLVVAGGVLVVSALTAKGPLAAWRVVPRRLHLYLDLLLAGCFAVSPLLYLPGLPLIPIVISEAVAVVLVRMSLTTEIVERARPERRTRRGRAASSSGPANTTADATKGPAPTRNDSPDAVAIAAGTAGRLLGTAVARAKDSGAPLAAARVWARHGHARRLGRAATAPKTVPPAPKSSPLPPSRSTQPADQARPYGCSRRRCLTAAAIIWLESRPVGIPGVARAATYRALRAAQRSRARARRLHAAHLWGLSGAPRVRARQSSSSGRG